ncbi:MAG: hypothetical protein FJY92_09815, partial [Candidatus Hydrogenedentes bacterium]|nr:hypothetical protein [Candidatus Hydrogenedentota bacterium]
MIDYDYEHDYEHEHGKKTRCTTVLRCSVRRAMSVLLFAVLACAAPAQAPPQVSPTSTVFDTLTRWLTVLGERTEDLLAPRFGHVGDAGQSVWEGLTARTRDFEESYPVRANCTVSIARDIGEGVVRVATWDNPVVRVHVSITAGAEQAEAAQDIADKMKVVVSPSPDTVAISVEGPGPIENAKTAINLDYEITVPTGASVTCTNDWGDTAISGVAGAVEVDSRFGAVDLRNIGGPVRARAWGEFPLRAYQLRQGGSFELQGTQGEFANVSGALKISNFMGSVTVRELPAESELDVTCESGPIELFVPENATPEISASAAFGSIASDIGLDRTTRGDLVTARGGAAGSKQRLSLHASFSTITIHQEGVKPPDIAQVREGGELVRKNIEQTIEVPPGAGISIKAVAGDVSLTPTDSPLLTVRAALVVQMQTNANAQAAIEALSVRTELIDGRAMLTTAVRDNMAALGCTRYRIDLEVQCPRASPVRLAADSGFTRVTSISAPMVIEQGKGSVSIGECVREAGDMLVTMQEGDIAVADSAGPLTATTQQGSIRTNGVTGKQTLATARGRATVELPKGE